MGEALRQVVKLWATIFVVYALFLNAVLPSFAASAAGSPSTAVICTVAAGDPSDRAPSSDPDRHGLLCCVICNAATAAALPVAADAATIAAMLPALGEPVRIHRVILPPSTAARPQSPRAPPGAA